MNTLVLSKERCSNRGGTKFNIHNTPWFARNRKVENKMIKHQFTISECNDIEEGDIIRYQGEKGIYCEFLVVENDYANMQLYLLLKNRSDVDGWAILSTDVPGKIYGFPYCIFTKKEDGFFIYIPVREHLTLEELSKRKQTPIICR